MKKLLSLLSVLTISGSAAPTTIAASPYQKEEETIKNSYINYSQTNNLEKLTRNKRNVEIDNFNINYIEKLYAQDWTKDLLRIWISKETWNEINFLKVISSSEEFKNKLFLLINNFTMPDNNDIEKENQLKILNNNDKEIIINKIIEKYNEIKEFQNNNTNRGLIITTTIDGKWFKNTSVLSQFINNNEVNFKEGEDLGSLKVECCVLCSDNVIVRFKKDGIKRYINNFRKLTWLDFSKWIFDYINTMPREDYTCVGGSINSSDISIGVKAMKTYFFKIENNICNLREKNINDSNCNDISLKTDRAYNEEHKIVIN